MSMLKKIKNWFKLGMGAKPRKRAYVRRRERGIGLLELMLSVAIIALLLIVATRYFISARAGQQVVSAFSLIQGLRAAAANYALMNNQGNYQGISIKVLVDNQLLPTEFCGSDKTACTGAGATPWGTNLGLVATSPSSLQVSLPAAPAGVCAPLVGALLKQTPNVSPSSPSGCTVGGNTDITAAFNNQ